MIELLISIGFVKITSKLYQYKKQEKVIEFEVHNQKFSYIVDEVTTILHISSANELLIFIKIILNDEIKINKNVISTKDICAWLSNEICTLLELPYCEFIGDTKKLRSLGLKVRSQNAVLGRSIFSHIIYNENIMNFDEIGRYLSNRDHSTIINSKNQINNAISIQDDRYDLYKKIKDKYDRYVNSSVFIEDKGEIEAELASLRLSNIKIQQYLNSKIKDLEKVNTKDRDIMLTNKIAIHVYKDLNKQFF